MFCESLTFGEMVALGKNLKEDNDKQALASFYKLPKKELLSGVYALSQLRNFCAHHSRVWNRKFTSKIYVIKKHTKLFDDIENIMSE